MRYFENRILQPLPKKNWNRKEILLVRFGLNIIHFDAFFKSKIHVKKIGEKIFFRNLFFWLNPGKWNREKTAFGLKKDTRKK